VLRTCSHVALFSPGALDIAAAETPEAINEGDGKRVRRRFPFSSQTTGEGVQLNHNLCRGTRPHLCLTRSETESCRNRGKRRERCTTRHVGPKRKARTEEDEAGRKIERQLRISGGRHEIRHHRRHRRHEIRHHHRESCPRRRGSHRLRRRHGSHHRKGRHSCARLKDPSNEVSNSRVVQGKSIAAPNSRVAQAKNCSEAQRSRGCREKKAGNRNGCRSRS